MVPTSKTFLEYVNDSIDEAGVDLASFAVDGSDFTTNTDAMMNRFKKWVKRAWRDIQQESFDWEWMSQQAVVNITPGIMFYSPHVIDWDETGVNPLVIYDVDGTAKVEDLTASKVVDLTGTYTDLENFGYVDVLPDDYSFTNQHTLDFGMKAGGEYFVVQNPLIVTFTGSDSDLAFDAFDGDSVGFYEVILAGVSLGSFSDSRATVQSRYSTSGLSTVSINLFNIPLITSLQTILSAQAADVTIDFEILFYDQEGGTLLGNFVSTTANILFCFSSVSVPIFPIEVSFRGAGVTSVGPGPVIGDPITSIEVNGLPYENAGAVTRAEANFVAFNLTNIEAYNAIFPLIQTADEWTIDLFTTGDVQLVSSFRGASEGAIVSVFVNHNVDYTPFNNYIHSWKSYDWSEELDDDDFAESIREIDQKSFRVIYHDDPAVAAESPLTFVPWDEFQNKFDFASSPPSTPRMVTEDNTGRWRFYPPPNRPYTILFDYVREPQIISEWDDVPKGLPQEYEDLIMWRAIQYWAEFDKQPDDMNRGYKNYKNLLMKFEQQTRPKFHFKSAFSFGGQV